MKKMCFQCGNCRRPFSISNADQIEVSGVLGKYETKDLVDCGESLQRRGRESFSTYKWMGGVLIAVFSLLLDRGFLVLLGPLFCSFSMTLLRHFSGVFGGLIHHFPT
jgi:hypothetical protein